MGLFNTVRSTASCPRCEQVAPVVVQFKYGSTRQHEYSVGELLRWGENDIGTPGCARVVADAVVERGCQACGLDEWDLYVFLSRDRIVEVVTATGEYDFLANGESFIVLDPGSPPAGM